MKVYYMAPLFLIDKFGTLEKRILYVHCCPSPDQLDRRNAVKFQNMDTAESRQLSRNSTMIWIRILIYVHDTIKYRSITCFAWNRSIPSPRTKILFADYASHA